MLAQSSVDGGALNHLRAGLYPATGIDIGWLSMTGDRAFEFLVKTDFTEAHPAVSPNGRWVAYHSNRSGASEVYVERFPDLGSRQLISTDGGILPLWSPDGRELFYMTPGSDKLVVVSIDNETGFTAEVPEVLFEGNLRRE